MAAAAIATCGLLAAACSRTPEPEAPRLVLLYAPCTVSKQFLSPYASGVPYTPHLQSFADRGVVFEKHHTESGQSGISFASIFSGTQATTHGIFSHPNRLPDDLLLITEAFAERGYDSYAFLAHQMASGGLGYAQGVVRGNGGRRPLTADNPTFRRILARLRDDPDYRAFIVTNFTVTHGPYRGAWLDEFCTAYPGQCDARRDRAGFERYSRMYGGNVRLLGLDLEGAVEKLGLGDDELARLADVIELRYKSTVFQLDRMFGAVVDAIAEHDLLDRSLVAFTADHGEIFYRPNALLYWTHGFQLAPEVIGVPWIVAGPGAAVPTGSYDGNTRSIDVFPTLAGLAGLEMPEIDGFGHDLSHAVRGEEAPPELLAFSHTPLYQPRYWEKFRRYRGLARLFPEQLPELLWVGVRTGDVFAKLRRTDGESWQTAIFDLGTDPGETRDLFDENDEDHRRLVGELRDYKARLVERAYQAEGTVPRKRSLELLRSLGYID